MGAGRPKKTLEDLPEDWENIMYNIAGQGGSAIEIRVELNCISDDLWYRFIEEEPEFSRAVKKSKILCQNWWEKNGRLNLDNKDFSYTGWYMNMKNRFGWKDKQEVAQDITSGGEKIAGITREIIDPSKD